jgi:gliding motility-associated-like protein
MRLLGVLLCLITLSANSQCDLEILGFDPVDLEMTLVVNNGYCGSASDSVGEFLFTLTFEPPIPPAENPFGCFDGSGNTNLLFPLDFPFVDIGEGDDEFISSGDTLTFSLIESLPFGLGTSSCWQEAINSGGFDSCVVLSINQINDSACLDGGCDGLGGFPYPDVNPDDNTISFSLTDACGGLPPPPLLGGCTDADALNFDPLAEFDDGTCEYVDLSLFYLFIQYGCDPDDLSWNFTPNVEVTNWGNVAATSFCVDIFVNGEDFPYQTECFEIEVNPDEEVMVQLPTYTPEFDGYELPLNSLEFVLSNVEGDFNENNDFIFVDSIGIIIPTDCFIEGCTDETANNFNPDANVDDGSCTYDVLGCTDETANNFNPDANVDDGSCTYDVLGCTDETANNFNPDANVDDGSCTYDVLGCTDETALNYNPDANVDDGSCIEAIEGCTDPFALNYNPQANVNDGSCYYSILGCMDSNAINYNPDATIDDDSCIYELGMSPDCIEPLIFVPNVFTPNNDGVNDVWQAVTLSECFSEWLLLVFNRWGNIVWESKDPDEVWLGEGRRGTHFVSDGVYIYTIKAKGVMPSASQELTGHLTILR